MGVQEKHGAGKLGGWTARPGGRIAAVLVAAVALAAAALLALPSAPPTQGVAVTAEPVLIGEHSALGERRVDAHNQALAAFQNPLGEHAGMSRADNEAEGR
jgi:hypothetical protein